MGEYEDRLIHLFPDRERAERQRREAMADSRALIGSFALALLMLVGPIVASWWIIKDETPEQRLDRLERQANRDCSQMVDPFKGGGWAMCAQEKETSRREADKIKLSLTPDSLR